MIDFKLDNVSAGYTQTATISAITAHFEGGNFYALIGPNGGGKSTLLKTLSGLLPLQSGHIDGLKPHKPSAQHIAYMAQTRLAHPQMKVADIVALGREPYRRPFRSLSHADKNHIQKAITRLNLEALADKTYGTLSGGQQARVHLARALAVDASILLVDEPVASLDPYYQLSILEVLKAEAQSGRIVIAALHDLSLVKQFTSHICVMHNGRLAAMGETDTTLSEDILKSVFQIRKENSVFVPC